MDFFLEIHGCPKAIADAEYVSGILLSHNHEQVEKAEDAKFIIVQTCSFIKDSREESKNAIKKYYKSLKKNQKLIVIGCYPEIFYKELKKDFPEAIFVGANSLEKIHHAIKEEKDIIEKKELLPEKNDSFVFYGGTYWNYLRISEGCSHKCSFCIIPKIRGKYRSRSIDSILLEAQIAEEMGKKELIIVSQDSSFYGMDVGKPLLKKLLLKLNDELRRVKWIRVMYLNPMHLSDSIIEVFGEGKILPYFDIPFQHSDEKILKLMKRSGNGKEYLKIINKIRKKIKNPTIRTSLIVGFPEEGKKEFENLKDFVKNAEFDHLGVFEYSDEPLAESFKIKRKNNKSTIRSRKDELIKIQTEILKKHLKEKYLQNSFEVLDEIMLENGLTYGRTIFQAPEGIDGWSIYPSRKRKKIRLYDFDFEERLFYGE